VLDKNNQLPLGVQSVEGIFDKLEFQFAHTVALSAGLVTPVIAEKSELVAVDANHDILHAGIVFVMFIAPFIVSIPVH
jgi:hypothetical protein